MYRLEHQVFETPGAQPAAFPRAPTPPHAMPPNAPIHHTTHPFILSPSPCRHSFLPTHPTPLIPPRAPAPSWTAPPTRTPARAWRCWTGGAPRPCCSSWEPRLIVRCLFLGGGQGCVPLQLVVLVTLHLGVDNVDTLYTEMLMSMRCFLHIRCLPSLPHSLQPLRPHGNV